jgi:hypothetical protein
MKQQSTSSLSLFGFHEDPIAAVVGESKTESMDSLRHDHHLLGFQVFFRADSVVMMKSLQCTLDVPS